METTMKTRPKTLTITLSNGKTIDLDFTEWKASRASGRLNSNAITKAVIDGKMVQVGCNVTVLD